MAIQVSGVNVIDNERNASAGVVTATSLDVNPTPITFSPSDGSSDTSLDSNIVITYNASISKGSGNITLREGSASGTVIETIAVSSGAVTVSSGELLINPPIGTLPAGKDIYVVVDEGVVTSPSLNSGNDLIDTYNFTTGPITVSSFSPSDGAVDQAVDTNIVITFSNNIAKGSGNITLRAGSASGTIRQTIDVTSGAVSVSGAQATINPPSDLNELEDIYVVVDAGCFTNTDGDSDSANAIINTYNFTAEAGWPSLGAGGEGGYLMCCASSIYWVVAPSSTEVRRCWYERSHAVTTANANAACGDWFIPSCTQLQNPGYQCRQYWDSYNTRDYWSNTQHVASPTHQTSYTDNNVQQLARYIDMNNGSAYTGNKTVDNCVRAFRCVSY